MSINLNTFIPKPHPLLQKAQNALIGKLEEEGTLYDNTSLIHGKEVSKCELKYIEAKDALIDLRIRQASSAGKVAIIAAIVAVVAVAIFLLIPNAVGVTSFYLGTLALTLALGETGAYIKRKFETKKLVNECSEQAVLYMREYFHQGPSFEESYDKNLNALNEKIKAAFEELKKDNQLKAKETITDIFTDQQYGYFIKEFIKKIEAKS